ncbi:MAG TPA: hypothetical protein VFA45_13965 [Actinomycetes bacterium]|nr:hypothetical protein [Actinomycetes bacterium]
MLASHRSRTLTVAVATFTGALLLLANPALASDPAGDNGTVKVDNLPFDTSPDNEPHDGCTFQVDFYGFDEGDLFAEVTFLAWPPTKSESDSQVLLADNNIFIGEDDSSGGGSVAGLDAERTYTLDPTGITPHPKQGFHVKLVVHADGSQGADTKYKVFWVTGCGGEETTTTTPGETTTTTPGETTTTVPGETTTSQGGGGGGVTSTQGPTTSLGGAVKGKGALPFTGTSSAVPMTIAGLAMLALGAASLLTSRARQRRSGGNSNS